MCTIGRTSIKSAGKTDHQSDEAKCTAWSEQRRTDYGAIGCRNSFLNTVFEPLAPQNLIVESYDGYKCEKINVITQENYEFLRDSYFRYAKLLKKKATHTPSRTIGESIARLHDEMDELIGENLNVNIEQTNGRLHFTLWKVHAWGSYTLYYFPIKFLESLNPTLRRIASTFIHDLMKANGIWTMLDDDETECIFDMLSDSDCDYDSEEWANQQKLLDSYRNGKINTLLDNIGKKSYYKNLPKALDSYKPKNGFEQPLIDIMKKGLPFLTPERGIMRYGYDAFFSENPDFHPMYLEQQIRIVYDSDDIVTDYMVDYYNSNWRESYEIIPTTTYNLSPDTDSLFHMDDYPERFFKWADEFITLIK